MSNNRVPVKYWPFSATETIGGTFALVTFTITVVLWAISTFESKEAAKENKINMQMRIDSFERQTRLRIDSVEIQTNKIRDAMDGVAKDVSYIRGRLEPKNGGGG